MMNLALNLVAIALSLNSTAASPEVGNPGVTELKSAVGKIRRIAGETAEVSEITYRIRVIEMDGLDWRTDWFERLTPVAQQGNATIWTAPVRAAGPIVKKAARSIASPPPLTASSRTASHISTCKTRSFVSRVSWNGDKPSTLTEAVREGVATTIVGRRIDQGILAQVVIEDTELRRVHEVRLASQEKRMAAVVGHPEMSAEMKGDQHVLQVPEFASREVAGEWLIPNDAALLVSLGVHTAAGPDGRAIVRERLMLIEATDEQVPRTALREPISNKPPTAPPSTIPAPVTPSPSTTPAPATPSPSANPIPSPTIPSRTLPQGVHADGTPAELPPLPEDTALPEPDESAEPHGSPQTRPKRQTLPMPNVPDPNVPKLDDPKEKSIDPRSTKASFAPDKVKGIDLCCQAANAASNLSQWSRVKSLGFPASLDRWIETVRARGALTKDDARCDVSACPSECEDEN